MDRAPRTAPGPGRRDLVLQVLRDAGEPCSIADLAAELRVHPNTIRFHLDALLRAGRVERLLGDSAGPGRPPVRYRAIHTMDPDGPTNYRLLARIFAGHLVSTDARPAQAARQLGRRWGARLVPAATRTPRAEALRHLRAALAEIGFAPEVPRTTRDREIRLRHCPFLDLVDEHGEVICALHLGLMQGALTALRAPVTVTRLDPLVEPDLCVAHL